VATSSSRPFSRADCPHAFAEAEPGSIQNCFSAGRSAAASWPVWSKTCVRQPQRLPCEAAALFGGPFGCPERRFGASAPPRSRISSQGFHRRVGAEGGHVVDHAAPRQGSFATAALQVSMDQARPGIFLDKASATGMTASILPRAHSAAPGRSIPRRYRVNRPLASISSRRPRPCRSR